jgi:VWFA-related protein
MTRTCALVAACSLLFASLLVAGAGRQAQTTPPQFRSSVDMVVVDVSVLDRRRQPVRGLTGSDFTVLEDGVPQTVEAFEAFDVPDPPRPPARWMARAPFDIQRNDMPPGRLVVIFMNDQTSAPDPFALRTGRETAHAIVDQLGPDDVAAVAFVLNYGASQEFTTDRARLHAAVDKYDGAFDTRVSVAGSLRDLAATLGAIPERRKIIIYIGYGVGFDMDVMTTLDRVTAQGGSGVDALARDDQLRQYDFLMNLFRVAQRSNVSIYMVNPSGLSAPNAEGRLPTASHDFMRLVAANTGARAIVNNNSPAQEMPAVMRENAAYYLLG